MEIPFFNRVILGGYFFNYLKRKYRRKLWIYASGIRLRFDIIMTSGKYYLFIYICTDI